MLTDAELVAMLALLPEIGRENELGLEDFVDPESAVC